MNIYNIAHPRLLALRLNECLERTNAISSLTISALELASELVHEDRNKSVEAINNMLSVDGVNSLLYPNTDLTFSWLSQDGYAAYFTLFVAVDGSPSIGFKYGASDSDYSGYSWTAESDEEAEEQYLNWSHNEQFENFVEKEINYLSNSLSLYSLLASMFSQMSAASTYKDYSGVVNNLLNTYAPTSSDMAMMINEMMSASRSGSYSALQRFIELLPTASSITTSGGSWQPNDNINPITESMLSVAIAGLQSVAGTIISIVLTAINPVIGFVSYALSNIWDSLVDIQSEKAKWYADSYMDNYVGRVCLTDKPETGISKDQVMTVVPGMLEYSWRHPSANGPVKSYYETYCCPNVGPRALWALVRPAVGTIAINIDAPDQSVVSNTVTVHLDKGLSQYPGNQRVSIYVLQLAQSMWKNPTSDFSDDFGAIKLQGDDAKTRKYLACSLFLNCCYLSQAPFENQYGSFKLNCGSSSKANVITYWRNVLNSVSASEADRVDPPSWVDLTHVFQEVSNGYYDKSSVNPGLNLVQDPIGYSIAEQINAQYGFGGNELLFYQYLSNDYADACKDFYAIQYCDHGKDYYLYPPTATPGSSVATVALFAGVTALSSFAAISTRRAIGAWNSARMSNKAQTLRRDINALRNNPSATVKDWKRMNGRMRRYNFQARLFGIPTLNAFGGFNPMVQSGSGLTDYGSHYIETILKSSVQKDVDGVKYIIP